jgi:hypothetical protein
MGDGRWKVGDERWKMEGGRWEMVEMRRMRGEDAWR